MTLKQALNVIAEARYSIVVHDETGAIIPEGKTSYETVKIDYVHDDKCYGGSFSKANEKRSEILKAKNIVKWISYNTAINMIEISVDILS